MRKSALILLLFILSVGLFANSRIDNLFQEALTDFESRDYQNALEKFRSIENEGIINANLFYNIGNCYFRLNEIGRSILYFRKALKVKSNHEPARRNLEFVLTFTKDKQDSGSEDVIRSFWKRLFDSFSINLLAVITIIIFSLIILLICLTILFYREREKTVPLFITTILIFFLFIFLILSLLKWRDYHIENEGVLLALSAIGYSGPSNDFTRVFTIHEGMTFEIERQENDWCLIKLPIGLGGWIKIETFERIKL